MSNKSILEQALLQVQTLEEAVKANAKGILASTMKQELNDLLRESLEEEEKVDEQPDSEEDTDDVPAETGDDESPDNEDDEPSKDIDSMDDDDMTPPMDDMDTDDDMTPPMDDMDTDDDMTPPMDDMDTDDNVLDMTNADEDEILKVFKAMGPNDGVIVKKDDNHIELSDGDDEYIIKLDEDEMMSDEDMMGDEMPVDEDMMGDEMPVDEDEMMGDEMPVDEDEMMSDEMSFDEDEMMGDEMSVDEDEMMSDETVYEIELDDVDEGDVEPVEGDVEEAARTKSNLHGDKFGMNRAGIKSKKMYKAGSGSINEEVSKLKKQNDEYKKALVLFKEKLNEVAVFNANLAYATRLFTEHSTTKQEKLNILKRFDLISTLKESKNLYSSIKSELGTKKPVTESVVEKINLTPTSSSTNVLSESKAYENPQFKRMKDLMQKLK
jgi:hypothetical protein